MTQFMGRTFLPFMANKKTYLVAAIIAVLGGLEGFGVHIPGWAMWVLGAAGLATHRAAISQVMYAVIADRQAVATLLATVSTSNENISKGENI